MHWWYLPDSYDEWINKEFAPDQLQLDVPPVGSWKLYIRWVYDSEKFNEWMNPTDYETKEAQEEQEQLLTGKGEVCRLSSEWSVSDDDDGIISIFRCWSEAR